MDSESPPEEDGYEGTTPDLPTVAMDTEIRAILRSLPDPDMPPHVTNRLMVALRAESSARSGRIEPVVRAASDTAGHRRPAMTRGWLAGVGMATAAAGIVTIALLATTRSPEMMTQQPVARAAVVAMSTSGTKYRRRELATQVTERWRRVSSTRTGSPTAAASIEPGDSVSPTLPGREPTPTDNATDAAVVTIMGDPSVAGDVLASSFASTHDGVVACLGRVAPGAEPVMIDMGTFHADDTDSGVPAAVLAYVGSATDRLDVYVVDRACSAEPTQVMAHVTAEPTTDGS